ncbi:MAG: hypothetical protein D6767_04065 [Candidatus Hydrogenedentota bacterium]|nr:MAG: hypothetical protein D6767_04065 [Candidatus Hydrogenedentota bacterium]
MFGLPGSENLWKFSFFLAGLGYLLSFLVTLIAGAGVFAVIIRPILSALFMGGVGAGIYLLLQKIEPEFLEEFESMPESSGDELEVDLDEDSEPLEEGETQENIDTDFPASEEPLPSTKIKPNQTPKEDEIVVEGVAIKNDPQVMADAIQHVMSQDE